jgi:hypothetical protein
MWNYIISYSRREREHNIQEIVNICEFFGGEHSDMHKDYGPIDYHVTDLMQEARDIDPQSIYNQYC